MNCSLCQFHETVEVIKTKNENLYLCEDCFNDYNNGAEWIELLE